MPDKKRLCVPLVSSTTMGLCHRDPQRTCCCKGWRTLEHRSNEGNSLTLLSPARWSSPFATASPGSFTEDLRIAAFLSPVSGGERTWQWSAMGTRWSLSRAQRCMRSIVLREPGLTNTGRR